MKKKKIVLLAAGGLFVSVNLFLTFMENSKVERTSYVRSWTSAIKENVTAKLNTSGVVTPLEEHHVYYDERTGEFKNFLIAEGDKVDSGTPLYEFSSERINNSKQKLETEKSQLQREVTLIDEQIQQLTYLQSISTTTATNPTQDDGDGSTPVSGSNSGEIISISIEKEIYDKELEKSRLQGEIQKYEQSIQSYGDGNQLGINSEVAGTVKKINFDLSNPIVTIVSDTPKIEGTFTEEELKDVQTGMKVNVVSELAQGVITGTLTKIAPYPEKDAHVKKKSTFPFEIQLEKESGELVQGTHVDVSVITKEIQNAVTIPNKTIVKKMYAYVLNDAGKIEKREIDKGIQHKNKTQIEKGLAGQDRLIQEVATVKETGGYFITKVNLDKLDKKWLKAEPKTNIFKWIGAAFLKR